MSKFDIINSATRAFGKTGLKLKKYAPDIMIVAGTIGVVTSGVLACRATLKVNNVIEEHKEQVEKIHAAAEKIEAGEEVKTSTGELYSAEDVKKDTAIVYVQTGIKFVKLYGPAIALGALSLTAIAGSHNILKKRNVALSAAFMALNDDFKAYRGRVVDRFGKNLDRELRYNIKAEEVEEVVVNEKTGKEKTVKKTINVPDPNIHSEYARFFDESCAAWCKDTNYNSTFVIQQQNYANEKLKADGFLFLNDVYEMLGIPKCPAGQIVGWIYDENNPNGDNFVDFGIFDIENENARDFVNGRERTILLDFNVDGPIYELI